MSQTESQIRINGITIHRGGQSVLSLEEVQIPIAGITGLIGPNGAGKTTLLRLLHGLLRPDTGTVAWPKADPPRRAMVLQQPVLLRRSVEANLDFILKHRGLARPARKRQIERLLVEAGLDHRAKSPARRLSGGAQRRLAVAQALAQDPEMLFLDEPTAGLDPAAAAHLEEMIRMTAQSGIATLISSHDLGLVRRLADRILFLHAGQVIAQGPATEEFQTPSSKVLDSFLKGEQIS